MTIGDAKTHLEGLFHGGDVDKLDDIEYIFERASNTLLSNIKPLETIRTAGLSSTVHDDIYNYALPSDFGSIIDLIPQDSLFDRNTWDKATRNLAGEFDVKKAVRNKVISIEGSEGSKIIRINWRSRQGKVLNTMDSVTANGTWSIVGSATGLAADSIFKVSGSASIKFTHVVSGDGIQNTTMSVLDLTDESGVADVFVPMFFQTVPTSVTAIWGNDLTTNYWTSVAQTTQADGTAFKVGFNILKFPWSTATQTGSVTTTAIDSFKITLAGTALGTIRVDNIIFSIGRNFDLKYYSKYLLKNSSGTWINRTTSDSDVIVLDNDAIQIYLLETLIAMAQQAQRPEKDTDIAWARSELNGNPSAIDPLKRVGLYGIYRGENPDQTNKAVGRYSSGKPLRRRL